MTRPLFVILFIDLNQFFLSDYASEATTYASEETTHASEATTHASEATTHASEATTYASEAITHASEAITHASEESGWPPSPASVDPVLRSGFYVVPLFVPFWLRILTIFWDIFVHILNRLNTYFKNPQPKREKKRNNKEAATEDRVMKEMQQGTNWSILNLNKWRLRRLKVQV